jgi:transcriptional regulator with XRE-family HTH domain
MLSHHPEDFRAQRTALKYSQAKLAKLIQVTPLTILRWETGQSPINHCASVLLHFLYEQEVRGNKNVVRDYVRLLKR